ncbi:MAG: hypothetical protein HC765_15185 [Brachymonas sp.]|nr:hypothetical protein [Brachymonas sp.]
MFQSLNFSSPKLQRGMSKLLLLVCLAGAAWWGYQKWAPGGEGQQMAKLVAGLEASDVMIYGASWCPHCKAAKNGWESRASSLRNAMYRPARPAPIS